MQAAQFLTAPAPRSFVEYEFQRYAKLKPHSVIIQKKPIVYSYDENGNRSILKMERGQDNQNSLSNLAKGAEGQYNGYMSPATRRKVRGIIENFLTSIQMNTSMAFPKSFPSQEVYPTFLTLTLPSKQFHCDLDIRRDVFGRFIEWLTGSKKKGYSGYGVKNYIYCAETQQNGNIHFHVILDRAVPAITTQKVWNHFCENLGYVTRFRNIQNRIYMDKSEYGKTRFFVRKDMLESKVKEVRNYCKKMKQPFNYGDAVNNEKKRQLRAYNNGVADNWNNPPTTKIHAIQNIKKLTAYVSKYMTKEPPFNKPDLLPGQTLVEENGHYFIDSEIIEKVETIEGLQVETVSYERKPIIVKFETRILRGRTWGASKKLHSDLVKPMTMIISSTAMLNTTTFSTHQRKYQVEQHSTDLFGERVSEGMVTKYQSITTSEETRTAKILEGLYESAYIRFLKEEYVSKEEIEKATSKAGLQFQHFGGEIVPLEFHQKDVLKMYSPVLFQEYAKYYSDMFTELYAA